jgi:hypothetical protein
MIRFMSIYDFKCLKLLYILLKMKPVTPVTQISMYYVSKFSVPKPSKRYITLNHT